MNKDNEMMKWFSLNVLTSFKRKNIAQRKYIYKIIYQQFM